MGDWNAKAKTPLIMRWTKTLICLQLLLLDDHQNNSQTLCSTFTIRMQEASYFPYVSAKCYYQETNQPTNKPQIRQVFLQGLGQAEHFREELVWSTNSLCVFKAFFFSLLLFNKKSNTCTEFSVWKVQKGIQRRINLLRSLVPSYAFPLPRPHYCNQFLVNPARDLYTHKNKCICACVCMSSTNDYTHVYFPLHISWSFYHSSDQNQLYSFSMITTHSTEWTSPPCLQIPFIISLHFMNTVPVSPHLGKVLVEQI